MLGFGGHFLTMRRRYSVTFRLLRRARVAWQATLTTGPPDAPQTSICRRRRGQGRKGPIRHEAGRHF
jgi:hypothetical protein